MPVISIIVPVYNVEKYIHRCLDSIIAQTFTDWECILVDDGSPDNSGKSCDEYAEKDSRFVVIHQENGGVSKARNKGILAAKAEYITFVDSDDYIDTHFLEVLFKSLINNNADVCVSGLAIIYAEKIVKPRIETKDYVMTSREAIIHYGKCGGPEFRGPVAKLVKTEIARNNLFPTDRFIGEDLATNYRYYNEAKTIVGNDSKLYYCCLNTESATNQRYNPKNASLLITLEELQSFLKQNDFDDLFEYYKSEYYFELFNHYANLKMFPDYVELNNEIYSKLCAAIEIELPDNVDRIQPFITFLFENGRIDLVKIYIPHFLRLLFRNKDKNRIEEGNNILTNDASHYFKRLLKKYTKTCNITPYNHPEWFNFAFPIEMWFYWRIIGIKHKIEGK